MKAEIEVSYSQLVVCQKGVEKPFNEWTKQHVAQGFSWREESVGFMTVESDGTVALTVEAGERVTIREDAVRVIRVPFEVKKKKVEINTITETALCSIPNGNHTLYFQHGGESEDEMWVDLFFVLNTSEEPAILKADEAITERKKLLMVANPG
jgi:hypothetical protein